MRSESGGTLVPFWAVRLYPRAVRNTLSFIPAILVAAILQLGPTQAQVMRTYVSGTGNDSKR
jgi:hypothetical protein